MLIERRFVRSREPRTEHYEPVEFYYCCEDMTKEIKGTLADLAAEETDDITFLRVEGTIGLEKTARGNVPFVVCPFCGSDITTTTVEAVKREEKKVEITKEVTREVESEIDIPEED